MLRQVVQRVATQGVRWSQTTRVAVCRQYARGPEVTSLDGTVIKGRTGVFDHELGEFVSELEKKKSTLRTGPMLRLYREENTTIAKMFDECEDHWEVRGLINNLAGEDMIPAPEVVVAGLYALRRLDDHATAVRFLESVKDKCGNKKEIWEWTLSQIRPTLDTLGVSTPEEMGYDKPELYLQDVDSM